VIELLGQYKVKLIVECTNDFFLHWPDYKIINPFRRGSQGWDGLISHRHATVSANATP